MGPPPLKTLLQTLQYMQKQPMDSEGEKNLSLHEKSPTDKHTFDKEAKKQKLYQEQKVKIEREEKAKEEMNRQAAAKEGEK